MRSLAGALVLVSLLASSAQAAPTVAVLPFQDLSTRGGVVGEAIRQTVTSDLREIADLKVVERGELDRVLLEQKLHESRFDLEPAATVSVRRLLGATLMVVGASQRVGANVRFTARFVAVETGETGEIVGTAKVDGAATELFSLQDRVTTELLRSAGMGSDKVQRFARRKRPKLKSLHTVELYGDAVLATDDTPKRDFLRQALDEDPSFAYASKDLDELEKRLEQYEKVSASAQDRAYRELRARLDKETDPGARARLQLELLNGLRNHELVPPGRTLWMILGQHRFDQALRTLVLVAEDIEPAYVIEKR